MAWKSDHAMNFKRNMLNIQIVARPGKQDSQSSKSNFSHSGGLLVEQTNHRLSHVAVALISRESQRSATCASRPSQQPNNLRTRPPLSPSRPFKKREVIKKWHDTEQKPQVVCQIAWNSVLKLTNKFSVPCLGRKKYVTEAWTYMNHMNHMNMHTSRARPDMTLFVFSMCSCGFQPLRDIESKVHKGSKHCIRAAQWVAVHLEWNASSSAYVRNSKNARHYLQL